MTELYDLTPAQRRPVQRAPRTTMACSQDGAAQSWAGPGTDWFPFEGGAGQSGFGSLGLLPFEDGAGQSWAGPGTDWFPFES